MTGTAVETAFFNFDALYVPQDHPAREASDIYYVKDPLCGDIKQHAKALEQVKETHENGWTTGSTGWGYKYSLQAAQRLLLRGHGTCLSARTLETGKFEVPSKHFSIARVYRPEITDKTHLSEFNQVEGIVIDKNLNLKDLLGVLGKFAMEIAGADKIRFKPDYFPFTEPSVELVAYKEGLWLGRIRWFRYLPSRSHFALGRERACDCLGLRSRPPLYDACRHRGYSHDF